MEQTKIFLNTWGAYNNGSIGYGWMTPEQARDFIDDDPERDNGEWFIDDIDNHTSFEFNNLDCCTVDEIIEAIEAIEAMQEWEQDEISAIMEYIGTNDINEAIRKKDDYIIYSDIDAYHDSCDEALNFNGDYLLERYFDFDAFHRDCDYDIFEASNGVCILY